LLEHGSFRQGGEVIGSEIDRLMRERPERLQIIELGVPITICFVNCLPSWLSA